MSIRCLESQGESRQIIEATSDDPVTDPGGNKMVDSTETYLPAINVITFKTLSTEVFHSLVSTEVVFYEYNVSERQSKQTTRDLDRSFELTFAPCMLPSGTYLVTHVIPKESENMPSWENKSILYGKVCLL